MNMITYKHLYYYNVGGMSVDAQISVLKRFYYSKIGRGNPLIFSFDYIKTTSESPKSSNILLTQVMSPTHPHTPPISVAAVEGGDRARDDIPGSRVRRPNVALGHACPLEFHQSPDLLGTCAALGEC